VRLLSQENTTVTVKLAHFPPDSVDSFDVLHTYDSFGHGGDGQWHEYWLDNVGVQLESGKRLGLVFQFTGMMIPGMSSQSAIWTVAAGGEEA
jgi:hypothetical protein